MLVPGAETLSEQRKLDLSLSGAMIIPSCRLSTGVVNVIQVRQAQKMS